MTTQEQPPSPSNDPDLVTISVSLTGPRELIDRFRDAMDNAYMLLSDAHHSEDTFTRRQVTLNGIY